MNILKYRSDVSYVLYIAMGLSLLYRIAVVVSIAI